MVIHAHACQLTACTYTPQDQGRGMGIHPPAHPTEISNSPSIGTPRLTSTGNVNTVSSSSVNITVDPEPGPVVPPPIPPRTTESLAPPPRKGDPLYPVIPGLQQGYTGYA